MHMHTVSIHNIITYTLFFRLVTYSPHFVFLSSVSFFGQLLKAYLTDDQYQLNDIIIIFPHFDCVYFAAYAIRVCVCVCTYLNTIKNNLLLVKFLYIFLGNLYLLQHQSQQPQRQKKKKKK